MQTASMHVGNLNTKN